MNTPEFLMNQQPDTIDVSELDQLNQLVDTYTKLESEIAKQEEVLSKLKASFRTVAQERIPNLLRQHGLSDIRLKNGAKIIVKEDVSVSIPEDKKQAFFDFLKQRNEEDIIKLNLQFKQMPIEKQQELFEFLNNCDYEFEADRGVHPMTLKSYFKRLLGIGEEDRESGVAEGKYLKPQDIENVVNVFTFFNTKIK